MLNARINRCSLATNEAIGRRISRTRLVDSENDTAAMRLLATNRAFSFLYRMNVHIIAPRFAALFAATKT